MLSRTRCWLSVLLLVNVATSWAVERSDEQQEMLPLGQIQNHFDLADGDGSVEAALLNYLYAKQIVERLMNGRDVVELQRKRAYWKQCAFNAVSCFGRK